MKNTENMVELTPETYYDFANDCVVGIKDTKEKINELEIEFDDREEFIQISLKEIDNLKKAIKNARKEKSDIKYELSQNERSLSVDVKFLNKLNKTMNKKRSGTHVVDCQKKKVLKG